MSASATDTSGGARGPRARTVDRLRPRLEPRLRDATVTAPRGEHASRDDGSHTPPHGDAVLPRKPAT